MCQREFIKEQNHLGIKAVKRFILLFAKHVNSNFFPKERKRNFANVLVSEQALNSRKDKNHCAHFLKDIFLGIKVKENLLENFAQPVRKNSLSL